VLYLPFVNSPLWAKRPKSPEIIIGTFCGKNMKKLKLKIKKVKRNLKALARLEASLALKLAAKFLHFQLKIRPRIRLFTKVLLVLTIAFLASHQAVAYLKPKEAKIKINGQPILVADIKESTEPKTEAGIDFAISSRRSPFEFKRPVEAGYLSQGYSSYHRANDIATDFGSPIHPLGPGIVEFAGRLTDGKGNVVMVDHGDGLKSLYAHMDRIDVGVGNLVNANMTIGTVGLTGRTTGPHVHIEIIDNGIQVNPTSVLPD